MMIDSVQSPSKHIGSYFGSIFNRSQFRWARIFLGYTVLTLGFTTFSNRNHGKCCVLPCVFDPHISETFPRGGGYATDGGHLCHQGRLGVGFPGNFGWMTPASKKQEWLCPMDPSTRSCSECTERLRFGGNLYLLRRYDRIHWDVTYPEIEVEKTCGVSTYNT